MLTPLIRAVVPTSPVFFVDAKNPGTGKTLLSEICGLISCGGCDLGTAPSDKEEWRKRITSLLMQDSRFVIFDNIEGLFTSESLSSVATTGEWTDRKLQTNEIVTVTSNATWVVTGNNIQLKDELARRGMFIALDARCSRPYDRDCEYKHPDLREWVCLTRGEILAALLTLIRSWYSAGRPMTKLKLIGSFETWTRTIGSILAHIGLSDFNANRDKWLKDSDPESSGWERFMLRWIEIYGDTPKTVSQIKDDLTSTSGFEGVLPDLLSYAITGGVVNPNKVGKALRSKEGTRFGDDGLHIKRVGEYKRAIMWMVLSSSTPTPGEYGEFGEFHANTPQMNTCACTHAPACENEVKGEGNQTHQTHQPHQAELTLPTDEAAESGYEEF